MSKSRVALFSLLVLVVNLVYAGTQPIDQVSMHPAIKLLDENGANAFVSKKPYSSKTTCGECHNYDSITHAFHIEQGRDETRDDFGAKRGFPVLVGPGYFGGYNCMGGNNPERLAKKNNASAEAFGDLGSAGWIQRCSSCHAGGGWMEKDRNGRRYDEVDTALISPFDGDYYNRGTDDKNQKASSDTVSRWDWKKSGVVENDCLMCHVDLKALNKSFGDQPVLKDHMGNPVVDSAPLDLFRYVRGTEFIKDGLFRYTNTAILNYINLNLEPLSPELDKSVVSFERDVDGKLVKGDDGLPILNWNEAAFDETKEVQIPMLRFPDNDNCMSCHRTSNSRRGFYGFGDVAEAVLEENELVSTYKTDIHKNATWVEGSGDSRVERMIENCNACHTRNYFNSETEKTVDMDASHNFLKGNSDMDVRNDLDYSPGIKTCEYCHENAINKESLTHADGMLVLHNEAWLSELSYNASTEESRKRITQVHLDEVSCQACHITNKESRGKPIQILYRYRESEDGQRKITPYQSKPRAFWRDKNSGHVLNKTEADSVYKLVGDTTDHMNPPKGYIINPGTGEPLAEVEVYLSHGAWRFRDPEAYLVFIKLKNAYDQLMVSKGFGKPDMAMVWSEPNAYILSHNTRPVGESIQCVECHDEKVRGGFSSLLSDDGVLGKSNSKEIVSLIDPRLVTEGIVVLDMPFMKMDASGVVTENVADILYATKLDPSLTILKSATAAAVGGEIICSATSEVLAEADVSESDFKKLQTALNDSYANGSPSCAKLSGVTQAVFRFQSTYGNEAMRGVSLMSEINEQTGWLANSRAEFSIASDGISRSANYAGLGGLVSDVFSLEIMDKNRKQISSFTSPIWVKLPYKGANTDKAQVSLISSSDGSTWAKVDVDKIVGLKGQSEDVPGYVAFETNHFSYYALVDSTVSVDGSNVENKTVAASGGGSGCSMQRNVSFDPLLPMLVVLSGLYLWRRKGMNN